MAKHRADEIYRTGPETLIAKAPSIVAGTISDYSKQVTSQSGAGENEIPLKWTIHGQLVQPQVLKGAIPRGPIQFVRFETSMSLPGHQPALYWESVYDQLTPQGQAVLFFGDDEAKTIATIIPSGTGEQDFIALVRNVVQIQSIVDQSERMERWLSCLDRGPSDEGRKAALRSFIAEGGAWVQLDPALDQSLKDSRLSRAFRAFGFGIIAFNLTQEKWGEARDTVINFLCRVFATERDPKLAMQYFYGLSLIFDYCDHEDFRAQRKMVRRRLEDCLEQRPSLKTSGGPAVEQDQEEQYRNLRSKYLHR